MPFPETLKDAKGIPPISEAVWEKVQAHYRLLAEWNARMNLVSRKSFDRVWPLHYADSLWIAEFLLQTSPKTVADIGTGAGFPGMIVALRAEVPTILYERSEKKRRFLEVCVAELQLSHVALRGDFTGEKKPQTVVSRGAVPVVEIFSFFEKKLVPQSELWVTLGGSTPEPEPPPSFTRGPVHCYELPNGEGMRKLASYRYVPRGTSQKGF